MCGNMNFPRYRRSNIYAGSDWENKFLSFGYSGIWLLLTGKFIGPMMTELSGLMGRAIGRKTSRP